MTLTDRHGRVIDYLRLSITDRCNLNCRYCRPTFGEPAFQERAAILTLEEIEALARAAVAAGITKIRLTGGEPLVRRGVVDLCRRLARLEGLRTLALTTNGLRLADLAAPLRAAGLQRVNVSLDTLRPERFREITGHDGLERVRAGIAAAEAAGFAPIKINTVVMRGVNDDEVADLAALTRDRSWEVRFIELMPFVRSTRDRFDDRFVPIAEIKSRLPGLQPLPPAEASPGPAELHRLPGARGRIGFIAPLTRHFCGACNRLRLTPDGHLRLCLFAAGETDLKARLRAGAGTAELVETIRAAVESKPAGHGWQPAGPRPAAGRSMHAIGG